jgi:hypothetical protein
MNQITVIAADRTGLIAELSRLLAARNINVASMDGRAVGKDAILHIEVDDVSSATVVLTRAGCQVMTDDVLTFAVENVPGALARIASELAGSGIDIRTMRTVSRHADSCIVAIVTNDNDRAKILLAERLV